MDTVIKKIRMFSFTALILSGIGILIKILDVNYFIIGFGNLGLVIGGLLGIVSLATIKDNQIKDSFSTIASIISIILFFGILLSI